ncbi:hypothetical protein T484DRAFT_1649315, partial [Baffinella frigidus]
EYNASPREMFIKMVQIIDALNFIIEECLLKLDSKKRKKILFFNPIANNVCFSSFLQGWSFSLFQFSELYLSSQPSTCFSVEELVEKLWSHTLLSDSFQNSLKKKFFFTNSLFEEFVLIPLFKIIFLNLGESVLHIRKFIETELGVFGITKIELNLNREKLMSYCMGLFFGGCRDIKLIPNHTGLISAIFKNIFISKKIKNMNMKNIGIFWRLKFAGVTGKVFHSSNENKILLLSRLVKGKLLVEDHIFLSTETHQYYHQQKTLCKHRIKKIRLPVGRYSLTIKKIKTNCVFMIALQEKRIRKSAIFTDQKTSFLHLQSIFSSTLRNLIQNGSVAPFIIHIQPILSGNLKNLLKSIRNCVKIYPILASKFQKPEKISITGTGELYLDSFLFDLTEYFGNFDLKVSLPDIVRKETVAKQKKTQKIKWNKELHLQIKKNQKIFTRPYNDQNLKIHRFHWENFKKNQQFLKKTIDSGSVSYSFEKYNALSTFHSNSLWAFGPKAQYLQNCFLTNESEIGFASNNEKNFFSEGFQWSLKKGPILKMPLNEVEFILNTNRKENVSEKIKQIYPAKLRRIFQKNFLKKYPKIQEPIFFFESFLSRYFFKTFSKFLHLKNGCIFSIKFKEQNDTLFIRGKISAFESLHFEKDLKILTKGNGTCTLFFDEWDLSASEHQKKLLSTLI